MSRIDVSPREAHAARGRYRVVDVREAHELDGPLGRLAGAEHVPLSRLAAETERLAVLAPLLLVCRSGRRSEAACELLRELGVDDVANLAGGMIAWNRAGLPVLREEPRTLAALIDQIVSWVADVSPMTLDATRALVQARLQRRGVSCEGPSHAAVDELLGFVAESFEPIHPPDLDLSLAAFRRSLAVL